MMLAISVLLLTGSATTIGAWSLFNFGSSSEDKSTTIRVEGSSIIVGGDIGPPTERGDSSVIGNANGTIVSNTEPSSAASGSVTTASVPATSAPPSTTGPHSDADPAVSSEISNAAVTTITTAAVPTTVAAFEQRIYLNDLPVLSDEEGDFTWWQPPVEIQQLGEGDNGFWFTLAYGDGSRVDNWARWDFEDVTGRFLIEAWIPSNWATAHIQYNMWNDTNRDGTYSRTEYIGHKWLDQARVYGWQLLGEYDLDGSVRIEVQDNFARDDWRHDGTINTRLAVDAIRLVELSS